MAKINTSNLDKEPIISEYERKYGSGETMNKSMTYILMRFLIIGFFSVLLGIIVFGFIMSIKGIMDFNIILEPIKIIFNILGAAFMAFVGYFIGKKSE